MYISRLIIFVIIIKTTRHEVIKLFSVVMELFVCYSENAVGKTSKLAYLAFTALLLRCDTNHHHSPRHILVRLIHIIKLHQQALFP